MAALNDLRMQLKAALDNMWARIDARLTAIEQGGGTRSAPAAHGASGNFTTVDGKNVTVTDGLITSITSDRR